MFIAQTHLQLIVEAAILINVFFLITFNILTYPLSIVLFLSLLLSVFLFGLFSLDAIFLMLPSFSHYEFTHLFGPIALFAWVTLYSASNMLSEVKIKSKSIKNASILLFLGIGIAGGIMHRSFLILWALGWILTRIVTSKSFKKSSKIDIKGILKVVGITGLGFLVLEIFSKLLNKPILSPLLRVARLEENSLPSIKMVIENINLLGHVQGSCYWGHNCLGGADGYITLPMSIISYFGLKMPLFFGVLVVKKDYIDYFLPGILAYGFDAGYIGLVVLLSWVLLVTISGLIILKKYREKRESGSRAYLGREALLIGALVAFLSQSLIGLFLFNRTINGSALFTFIILSALIMCHIVRVRRTI